MTTPTQRTIKNLKDSGVKCGVVERWLRYAKRPGGGPPGIRSDFLGIIDIIALDHTRGVIGIQVCGADFAAHYRKITGEKAENTREWLLTPGAILELWSWRKVIKARGLKQKVWRPRIKEITLMDLEK